MGEMGWEADQWQNSAPTMKGNAFPKAERVP